MGIPLGIPKVQPSWTLCSCYDWKHSMGYSTYDLYNGIYRRCGQNSCRHNNESATFSNDKQQYYFSGATRVFFALKWGVRTSCFEWWIQINFYTVILYERFNSITQLFKYFTFSYNCSHLGNKFERELWNSTNRRVLPITMAYKISCQLTVSICVLLHIPKLLYYYICYNEVVLMLPPRARGSPILLTQ